MARLCTHLLPSNAAKAWFKSATIRYDDYYIRLYVSFNSWYQQIAHSTNDRVALNYLKMRPDIWDRYYGGHFNPITPYLVQLVELTQREPLVTTKSYWNGSIGGVSDWGSILEFWYHIRCVTVHGDEVSAEYLFLAYHTLHLFLASALDTPVWLSQLSHLHKNQTHAT